MNIIVTKFGGSSLADANQIIKVKNILFGNADRRYCVVSASGKRNPNDEKITDLLINLFNNFQNEDVKNKIINTLKDRYQEIVQTLGISFDVDKELNSILETSKSEMSLDYLASRGEYISARLVSLYCDAFFLDMQDVIIFDGDKVDYVTTYHNIQCKISECEQKDSSKKIIIPGFYGSTRNGKIKIFSRGGSDITGSLIARAVNATIYENWTDVSGVYFEDPRLGSNPKVINYITYTELRELSYMGASVLHEASIYPVSQVGIPINILNTNSPSDKGTMIVSNVPSIIKRGSVTGIAGKKNFSSILLQKALMNEEVGFLSKLLKIFSEQNISVEHCPTGIDTLSVIVHDELLTDKTDLLIETIKKELNPDVLHIENGISIIAIVGEGMVYSKNVTSKIFNILADNQISVKMIDQGSSGINIIIGISNSDYEKAMRALCVLQDFES